MSSQVAGRSHKAWTAMAMTNADGETLGTTVDLERAATVDLIFAPNATTVFNLKLIDKGIPYWTRPDLGIGPDDIVVKGRTISVTVHSLGAVESAATDLVWLDDSGKSLASAKIPQVESTDRFIAEDSNRDSECTG